MRLDINMEEEHRPCEPDLVQFDSELKEIGITLEEGNIKMKPQLAGYGLIGPESEIIINIDPVTLKLLFEYGAALIGIYKATDYVGAFFKKAVEKLGEETGAKIADILGRLWRNLYKRIRDMVAQKRPPKMVICFEFEIKGLPVYANMPIIPARINTVTEKDEQQAIGLLFYKVLPLLPELIQQAQSAGVNPQEIFLSLALPESVLDSRSADDVAWRRGNWHWHINIAPGTELIIDSDGQRKDRDGIK